MNYGQLRNNQNWNIGFCAVTPEELVARRALPEIHWLRHSFTDRFFADPFILSSDSSHIRVLVEEMEFFRKGVVSLLVVDRLTYRLVDRKVILDKDTHLSYPAIFRKDDDTVYIYPENYQSGQLTMYQLDPATGALHRVSCMASLPLTDATVIKGDDGKYYMVSTLSSSSRSGAYLYVSDDLEDGYVPAAAAPVVTGADRSRCGGNFFNAGGKLYRPAQNCKVRYGSALKVMEVTECGDGRYSEREAFELRPSTWKYNLGLHTLNFSPDRQMAVIDSYGYLYPLAGRMLEAMSQFKHRIMER
ncbi:MAG: hypothetical protein K2K37_04580 [Muribaculaceae bacterium]|nr:hypothetical protein [Muribaculaceae bacterium]